MGQVSTVSGVEGKEGHSATFGVHGCRGWWARLVVACLVLSPLYTTVVTGQVGGREDPCFGCGGGTDAHNVAVVIQLLDMGTDRANVSITFARTVRGFEASDLVFNDAELIGNLTESVLEPQRKWFAQLQLLGDNATVQVRFQLFYPCLSQDTDFRLLVAPK